MKVLNISSNSLKYLPYSINKWKELQALWLSENQVFFFFMKIIKFYLITRINCFLDFFSKTKPLIQLQQEKDKSGKRYLTCYLLPQEQIAKEKGDC